jgi:hypothetical protein
MALLLLFLNVLAASPQLHEQFHPDANSSHHQCAVTLFAHGQVDSAAVEISAVVPAAAIEICPQFTFSVFAPAIENLPAGRAPPASIVSLT